MSASKPYCTPFLPHDESLDTEKVAHLLEPFLHPKTLAKGQRLWEQGDTEGVLVYLEAGRIKIYRSLSSGRQLTLYVFEPGTLFGFTPFLSGTSYPAGAMALEPCKLRVASQTALLQAIRTKPEIALLLLRHLNQRLEEAFQTIERLSTRGIEAKVAASLATLLKQPPTTTAVIELPMSAAEYAGLLGITPESFSRSVSRLVKQGVVRRLGKNRFQVIDLERLRSMATDSTC